MVGTDPYVIAVEDDYELRKLWEVKLEFSEITAKVLTPQAALSLAPEVWRKANILVTDWMLNGYTGRDIIDQARTHNPNIRCHILTAVGNLKYDEVPTGVHIWVKPLSIETIITEALHGK